MNSLSPVRRDFPTDAQKIVVAIVDDDPHQLQSLSRGVSLFGYSCIVIEGRDAAVEFMASQKGDSVHVVIVDVSRKLAEGVCFILRLREQRPELPIIAVRGLEWDTQMEALKEEGISNLQRPFSAVRLEREIRRLLGKDS